MDGVITKSITLCDRGAKHSSPTLGTLKQGMSVAAVALAGLAGTNSVSAQEYPNTAHMAFEIEQTQQQLILSFEAKPGHLFNTLPAANSTSFSIYKYNPTIQEFDEVALVSRDIPGGNVTNIEFIGGHNLNTPGVRYTMALSSLTEGTYMIGFLGRVGTQGNQAHARTEALVEVRNGKISLRAAAASQDGLGTSRNNFYSPEITESIFANNIDITSIVANESNDGFTLTGEVEKLTQISSAPGTVPVDVAQGGVLVVTLEDTTTLEVAASYTRDAANNAWTVSAQLPASCEGKVLSVKSKEHSNFPNPLFVGPDGLSYLPTDGAGKLNDAASEAIKTPAFDIAEGYNTAVMNTDGTYDISYTLGDIQANHSPTATFDGTAGVFSANNTQVLFSHITIIPNTNYDVVITNGDCVETKVFEGNMLGVMDVVNITNDLKILRNPIQNNILELEYPQTISHLDVAIYTMDGKKIADYRNTPQNTAIIVNAVAGMYIAQVVNPITGTGKNIRFVIQ